jgi:integrase
LGTLGTVLTPNRLAKKSKIEPKKDSNRNRWKVDVPGSFSDTGKRYRLWFKTREEARDYIEKITGVEVPSAVIPSNLAMEADKARAILDKWNLDLVEAARELDKALAAIGNAGTLLEAAQAFRVAHDARTASCRMGEGVSAFMQTRENLRPSTFNSYQYTLERTFGPLHDETLTDITHEALERILSEKSPTSRAMHRRTLKVFWRWASSPPRSWCNMAVVESLEAPRQTNDSDIEILTVKETKSLLQAAEAESPAATIATAIALFAGVRMAELSRLTWRNIHEDYIEIGRSAAKKHSRRLIPICPTLRAWIDSCDRPEDENTLIVPPNWTDVFKSVRRRAGWDVAARLLSYPPKPTKGPWKSNACRHTCASVQIAIGTPIDDLVFKFGHSGGHDLLRRHYVSRLTKKDAFAILAIGPKYSNVSNIIAV